MIRVKLEVETGSIDDALTLCRIIQGNALWSLKRVNTKDYISFFRVGGDA